MSIRWLTGLINSTSEQLCTWVNFLLKISRIVFLFKNIFLRINCMKLLSIALLRILLLRLKWGLYSLIEINRSRNRKKSKNKNKRKKVKLNRQYHRMYLILNQFSRNMDSNKKVKCSWCQNCTIYEPSTLLHKTSNLQFHTFHTLLKVMISTISTKNSLNLSLQSRISLCYRLINLIRSKTNPKKISPKKKNKMVLKIISLENKKLGKKVEKMKMTISICLHRLRIFPKSNVLMLKMKE